MQQIDLVSEANVQPGAPPAPVEGVRHALLRHEGRPNARLPHVFEQHTACKRAAELGAVEDALEGIAPESEVMAEKASGFAAAV